MKKLLLLIFVLLLLPNVHAILFIDAQWENELDQININYGASVKFDVYARTTADNFNYVRAVLLDSDYNIIHTYHNFPEKNNIYLASFDVIKNEYKTAGEFYVIFEAQDNTGETHFKFLDLDVINHAPQITSTAPTNAKQDVEYIYDVEATDIDPGDVLTYYVFRYNATGVPEGMIINSETGLITWTPTNAQALVGQEKVTVIVRDENDASDEQSFTINIENINDAPVLDEIGNKLVNENQLLTFEVTANDIDNDVLIYSNSQLPQGATFEDNVFSWTPTFEQSGVYQITFTVSDNEFTDSETITITVKDINRAPVLDEIGDKVINENEKLEFTVSAADLDGDELEYSAFSYPYAYPTTLPIGAKFENQVFSWTPTYQQSGEYKIKFKVSDGELTDEEIITIFVGNKNRAPVLDEIGDKQVNENQLLTFTITASDPDNDELIYSTSDLPEGAKFEDQGFFWIPTYDQSGNYEITFTVSDSELKDEEIIKITVENVNRAPTLFDIGNKQINEGNLLQFKLLALDLDNDKLTFTASELPQGAFLIGNEFTWTPTYGQSGNYEITFTVSDGELTDEETIIITVGDINQPPILDYIGNKLVKENQLVTFEVTATDPDNDELTYSTSDLPEGTVFEEQTFSWTPSYEQSGVYQITFIVSDNQLTDSETITITVGNLDRAPYIISTPLTVFTTDSKFEKKYKYDVDAYDPDNDELTYSLITAPEGMKINSKTGLITWIPNRKQLGANDVVVQVSDGVYTDRQSFTINVITEQAKLAREKIHINTLQIINDVLKPGDLMLVNLGFSNQDNYNMDGRVTVSIPELAVRKRVKFSLDSGEKLNEIILLEIPYGKGEYYVMINIYDGDISRTKYRFVNII